MKMTPKKIFFKTIGFALLLSLVAMLPFLHDIITIKGEGIKNWVPDLGIQDFILKETRLDSGVTKKRYNGYTSYRTFIYFLCLHIFAAIGWAGWAKDAKSGKPYKFFLLIPTILTIYTALIILFNFRQTDFNEATTKIFIILVVNFLLMVFFLYRYFTTENKGNDKNG